MGLIILAVILFGLTHPMGALLIEKSDPVVFTFHYLILRVLWQVPLILIKPKTSLAAFKLKGAKYVWIAGLIGTFLHLSEFSALQSGIPISHITFLTFLAPAWLLLLESFKAGGNFGHVLKCLLALLGGAVIIVPSSNVEWNFGYLIPLLSSILIASWIEVSRRAREGGVDSLTYSFFYDLFALVGVGLGLVILGRFHLALNLPPKLLGFLAFALVIGVIPNILIFVSLKTQESLSASLLMSLEPVLSGIVSIILYDESLTKAFILGSSLIFFANMPTELFSFTFLKGNKHVSAQ